MKNPGVWIFWVNTSIIQYVWWFFTLQSESFEVARIYNETEVRRVGCLLQISSEALQTAITHRVTVSSISCTCQCPSTYPNMCKPICLLVHRKQSMTESTALSLLKVPLNPGKRISNPNPNLKGYNCQASQRPQTKCWPSAISQGECLNPVFWSMVTSGSALLFLNWLTCHKLSHKVWMCSIIKDSYIYYVQHSATFWINKSLLSNVNYTTQTKIHSVNIHSL